MHKQIPFRIARLRLNAEDTVCLLSTVAVMMLRPARTNLDIRVPIGTWVIMLP